MCQKNPQMYLMSLCTCYVFLIFLGLHTYCVRVGNVSWYITSVSHLIESTSLELRERSYKHIMLFLSPQCLYSR